MKNHDVIIEFIKKHPVGTTILWSPSGWKDLVEVAKASKVPTNGDKIEFLDRIHVV